MTIYELRSARGRPMHTFDDLARARQYLAQCGDRGLRLFEVITTERELGVVCRLPAASSATAEAPTARVVDARRKRAR